MNPPSDSETNNSESSSPETPRPTPRVSLPVRFSNPSVPESERPIAELTNNFLEDKTNQLTSHNDALLVNVDQTLVGVDLSLNNTQNILTNLDIGTMTDVTEKEVGELDRQLVNVSINEPPAVGPGLSLGLSNNVSSERRTLDGPFLNAGPSDN